MRLVSADHSTFFNLDSEEVGISAVGLRAIRVGRMMYDLARHLLDAGVVQLPSDQSSREEQAASAGTYARALGANSQDFVAEQLGVSRSTAKRLLALARERGLLDG